MDIGDSDRLQDLWAHVDRLSKEADRLGEHSSTSRGPERAAIIRQLQDVLRSTLDVAVTIGSSVDEALAASHLSLDMMIEMRDELPPPPSMLPADRQAEARHLAQRALAISAPLTGPAIDPNDEKLGIAHATAHFSLAISYKLEGDEVRSRQHDAKRYELNKQFGRQARNVFQRMAIDFTASPHDEVQAIDLAKIGLVDWVRSRDFLSIDDLGPRIGNFVTNDRIFYRAMGEQLLVLKRKLGTRFRKPENFLLSAEPGSGKSFFVREFVEELRRDPAFGDVRLLEHNLAAYPSVDRAFTDIVLDVTVALLRRSPLILFIDEVDTVIDGTYLFQRLIAPMNGDQFFFLEKQLTWSDQNLVVFFALSSTREDVKTRPKGPDFLSRIPRHQDIELPRLKGSAIDLMYRAVGTLVRTPRPVHYIDAAALLYGALRDWASSRELDQILNFAVARMPDDHDCLELADVAVSHDDIEAIRNDHGIDLYREPEHRIQLVPPRPR